MAMFKPTSIQMRCCSCPHLSSILHSSFWCTGDTAMHEAMRLHAAICWKDERPHHNAAIAAFETVFPHHSKKKTALIKYMKTNYNKFCKLLSVRDKPRTGRPRLLPIAVAKECAQLVMDGYTGHGGRRLWWTSVAAAIKDNDRLREVMEIHKVTKGQLLRAMRAAQPDLCRRNLYVKRTLPAATISNRLNTAAAMLDLDENVLKRTFWIDAAGIDIIPNATHKVWASRNEKDMIVIDPLMSLPKSKRMTLKYYAQVNYFQGACGLEYITGTTGVPPAYKVCSSMPAFGCVLRMPGFSTCPYPDECSMNTCPGCALASLYASPTQ